jgi:hypothetical protein
MRMTITNERRLWLCSVYAVGLPDIFGSMWDSDRLHWTEEEAEAEVRDIIERAGLTEPDWS